MCTLIALQRSVPGYDLIVAMNRDEAYARPSSPPVKIEGRVKVVAPLDRRFGGTWIGLNEKGLVVALANRLNGKVEGRRSRGLICLEALSLESARSIPDWLEEEVSSKEYNPFNLFYADGSTVGYSFYDGELTSIEGSGEVTIFTNLGVNETSEGKVRLALDLLEEIDLSSLRSAITGLKKICSCHLKEGAEKGICSHSNGFGTVSSTIIAVDTDSPWASHMLYSDGCPCNNLYRSYSHKIRQWFRP